MSNKLSNKFENNNDLFETLYTEDDEIIYVSKSEIKRDAEVLKKIGIELVKLTQNELDKLTLDEDLAYAISIAQKIKKEGYRRQIQFIGKLLRSRDIDEIQLSLDKLKNRHNQQVIQFHHLEKLRDDLIQTGDAEPILVLYPTAERQQLRQLARQAQKELQQNKPAKSSRLIFQYLKSFVQP